MKYLTLIRHAKSSWDAPGLSDHDRVLNERGLRQAPLVARFLAGTYFGKGSTPALLPEPDCFISSTATRAHTTAQLMLPEMGVLLERLRLEPAAYLPAAETLLGLVRGLDDSVQHAVIFAHNPGISDFADSLIRRGGVDEMPTSAAALIELPCDLWAMAGWNEGRLIGFITPRLIEKRFPDPIA